MPLAKPAPSPMRPLAQSLPLKLLQAREAVMDRFRPHLQAHGVTEQQWRVLRALAETGEIELNPLAQQICLLLPSLSRIIPDLEARGLVARRRDAADKRATRASLTREGRALFEAMSKHSEAIYREIQSALDAARCSTIIADLDRLIDALAAQDADQPPEAPSLKSRSQKV